MKSVLIYLDTYSEVNQSAFDIGLRIAQAQDASVKLVDVVQSPPWWSPTAEFDVSAIIDEEIGDRRKRLHDYAARAQESGVTVDVDVFHGKPFVQIIREVLDHDQGLVVKTMMPREGGPLHFGHTGRRLLRKCPCPVLLTKPDLATVNRICAAIGPPREHSDVSERILRLAQSVSAVFESELKVLHVWDIYGEGYLAKRRGLEELEAAFKQEEERTTATLHEFLDAIPSVGADKLELIKGVPQEVIPAYVKKFGVDLLVLGTVARTGLSGLLIGNTAEEILEAAPCSLLAVKPSDFVSPVTVES